MRRLAPLLRGPRQRGGWQSRLSSPKPLSDFRRNHLYRVVGRDDRGRVVFDHDGLTRVIAERTILDLIGWGLLVAVKPPLRIARPQS